MCEYDKHTLECGHTKLERRSLCDLGDKCPGVVDIKNTCHRTYICLDCFLDNRSNEFNRKTWRNIESLYSEIAKLTVDKYLLLIDAAKEKKVCVY